MAQPDARYHREEEFHNAETSARWKAVGRFYDTAETSLELHRRLVLDAASGSRVLDYGCGDGELSVVLAERAAHVTGIDISTRRIADAQRRAEAAGCADRVAFHVMNAEALSFADDSFDVACGTSILHHLDLDAALGELARVLRPDGLAFFVEPLGHNPMINLYRRLTPGFRTDDEHPLLMRDFGVFERHFAVVEKRYFHLASLAAVAARGTRAFPRVLGLLESFDRALFARLPFLRRYAWIVLLTLRSPHPPRRLSVAASR